MSPCFHVSRCLSGTSPTTFFTSTRTTPQAANHFPWHIAAALGCNRKIHLLQGSPAPLGPSAYLFSLTPCVQKPAKVCTDRVLSVQCERPSSSGSNKILISPNYKGLVNPVINNTALMSILHMLVPNWALDAERESSLLSRGKVRATPGLPGKPPSSGHC